MDYLREFAEKVTFLPSEAEAPGRRERMSCFSCCKRVDEPEESVRNTRTGRTYSNSSGGRRLTALIATFSIKSGRMVARKAIHSF